MKREFHFVMIVYFNKGNNDGLIQDENMQLS